MHVFLYGPPGSGKSTTGRELAQALKIPFLDLDAEIEKAIGQSISRYMTGQGESSFRNVESRVLRKAVEGEEKIIALGGGALLRDENRQLANSTGRVILLEAESGTLANRLSQDNNPRPLLAGELVTKLSALLVRRKDHYNSFDVVVDASHSPPQVAWEIQRLLGSYHLRGMGAGYDVVVDEGGIDRLGEILKRRQLHGPVLIISDTNVAPLYAERALQSLRGGGYAASQLVIPAGEAHKNLETVSSLWQGCLEADLDRSSTVLALGGGVVGDLTGFAAATFMRGCNWVCVPTTLLAMVDASLGGKTGFDLPEGKNLVGSFYAPRLVLADTELLSTLPERELRAGLAEVVKHGVIGDLELFNLCKQGWESVIARLSEVVRRGMAVKVKILDNDPYERGLRAVLNFGHTIGHAVELVSGFSLLHGEAVAIGMTAEARLAERLGVAGSGTSDALERALLNLGLPVEIPEDLSRERLISAMKVDKKKKSGVVRFALPVKIGEVKADVEVRTLEEVL